jgi:hypothetical protein
MTNTTIANTILTQLGGRRFLAMTGACNLIAGPNYLACKIPRAAKKITHMRVTLDPNDTYTVAFLNCRATHNRLKHETIETNSNIYAEDLQSVFTSTTGPYTTLGTMRATA